MRTLNLTDKQSVSYAIPLPLRDEQIKLAIARVKGRIQPIEEKQTEPIAIVSFGPSLNDTWKKIKKFKYVITCSGSHKFLLDKGLLPSQFKKWWHVEVDPRAHKTLLIGPPHKDIEYLIASTCHPAVFDHLEGHNVKLWHVFATEEDAVRVLPRGEWAVTGGCSVGLRTMTIARFFGFTDLHIFGMDGNEGKSGKHADKHPNQPKESCSLEYDGKNYLTTPAMLEAAKQTFHELDQMPDVKATFYGQGLVQHMAKSYKPNPVAKGQAVIGFNRPEVISEEYRALNTRLHNNNPLYGMGGGRHADTILKLAKSINTNSILDYGCGKGLLAEALPFPIWEYDPAIPDKREVPRPADLCVCTDVLEHIEPDKLMFVLEDLKRCTKKLGYFVIHTGPSTKSLEDGRNAHLIQENKEWWTKRLRKFFDVPENAVMVSGPLLHIVVAPKVETVENQITKVSQNGTSAKFYTPNDATRWRANTLLTKEPVTIEWINGMNPGETLFDVGANVGGYAIWAGVRGINVHAFEPEAENYALLVKNLSLNNIPPNAYCLALSDHQQIGPLHLSQHGAGGSCHSFAEAVGPDLQPRQGPTQGCVGMTLDELVMRGLPSPDHLKIDVDGLEFKVIKGAEHVLTNGLKSLLVEVNSNLPEHLEMVRYIGELGYEYDPKQVEGSTRKDGPFKGVAEYVFRRISFPVRYLTDALDYVELNTDPFQYVVIENALPETVYSDLVAHMPRKWNSIEKVRGTKYPKRFIADQQDSVWQGVMNALQSGEFKRALCKKFGVDPTGLTDETLLIRDKPGYAIGPHTDHPDKVISALFYLQGEEGTSLYTPRQKGFTCPGGPHHSFNKFKRVKTIPFKPNSLFVFLKSDSSFHGVETTKHQRDVLLYDVRKGLPPNK